MDLSHQPLRNAEGEVESIVVYDIDRTERVQFRRRAKELETTLQAMSHAVLAVNEGGETLFGNDLFKETFDDGASLSDGFALLDEDGRRLPPEETPQARAARGESFEMRFAVEENGVRRRFEARGRPIDGGGGVIVFQEVG